MTVLQAMEIERLTRELAELRDRPFVADFASRVGNNIMTILATMPFEQWPDLAKTAFQYAELETMTSAHIYKQRLPK